MEFRKYSNSITLPVEKKAIESGLVILGVSNVGRKQVTLQVEPAFDTFQFEALLPKRWSLRIRQESWGLTLTVNK